MSQGRLVGGTRRARADRAIVRARVGRLPDYVVLGIGDDAAIVEPERNTADVLTTDALVDGVHFDRRARARARHRPQGPRGEPERPRRDGGDAARRAAVARVAGRHARVATSRRSSTDSSPWPARHRTAVVGGNITRTSGPLFVDVTAIGSVRPGGACAARLLAPGTCCSSAAPSAPRRQAWRALRAGHVAGGRHDDRCGGVAPCHARARRSGSARSWGGREPPVPAWTLSDGLADAVRPARRRERRRRGGAGRVAAGAPGGRGRGSGPSGGLSLALGASDDYELLFAVPERRQRAFRAAARQARRRGHRDRRPSAQPGVTLSQDGRERPWPAGYEHFAA